MFKTKYCLMSLCNGVLKTLMALDAVAKADPLRI